jgi:hypothetical protein
MISSVTGSIIASDTSVVKSFTAISFRIRPEPHAPFFLRSHFCGGTGLCVPLLSHGGGYCYVRLCRSAEPGAFIASIVRPRPRGAIRGVLAEAQGYEFG